MAIERTERIERTFAYRRDLTLFLFGGLKTYRRKLVIWVELGGKCARALSALCALCDTSGGIQWV